MLSTPGPSGGLLAGLYATELSNNRPSVRPLKWRFSVNLPPPRLSGGPLLGRAVQTVAQYLREAFPGTSVSHRYESRGLVYRYVLAGPGLHLLVAQEFLEDHPPEEIRTQLASWEVATRLQAMPTQDRMVVTNDGYVAEPGLTSGGSPSPPRRRPTGGADVFRGRPSDSSASAEAVLRGHRSRGQHRQGAR